MECEASFWLENIKGIYVERENDEELILSPVWNCACLWTNFIFHNYSMEYFFLKDKSIVSRIINDFLFQLIIPVKGNTTEFLHFFLFLFLLDKVLWATDSNPVDWLFLFNYPRKQIMIFGCRKTLVIQHHPHIRVFHIKDFYLTEVSLFKWERCSFIFCWKSSSKMQWYILHCFLNERTLDMIY